jgi:hypothetical protein
MKSSASAAGNLLSKLATINIIAGCIGQAINRGVDRSGGKFDIANG